MDIPFKLLSHMLPVLFPHSHHTYTEHSQDGFAASDFFKLGEPGQQDTLTCGVFYQGMSLALEINSGQEKTPGKQKKGMANTKNFL